MKWRYVGMLAVLSLIGLLTWRSGGLPVSRVPIVPPSGSSPPSRLTPTTAPTAALAPHALPSQPRTIAALPPSLTLSRGMVALSPQRPPAPDPFSGLPILATRDEQISAPVPLIRRIRVVKTDFKYPLWRVEELVQADSATGPETPLARSIMVADHVLVCVQPNVSAAQLEAFGQRNGARIRAALHKPGYYLLALPDPGPDAVPRLLAALNQDRTVVRYAEPDHVLHATQTVPNDPNFSSLWGLHNTGQSGGSPDADIDAPEAWDLTTGSDAVVAAVIDTGVDYTHPDLASNTWSNPLEVVNGKDDDGNGYVDDINGWDFVNNDNAPLDDFGHGTHVAGTIAAAGNNGLGVVGVNWRCRIISLKFMDRTGSGVTSDAIEALAYAAGLRRRGINIRLTNNSWGGGGEIALSDAIRDQGEAGILFIAAAGNNGGNNDAFPYYPSSYTWSNIVTVAATDRRDALAAFSQYGANSVDLGAPGVDITSTTLGGSYGTKSGTSMATPHVAGVAALLWSAWSEASWQDVRDALLKGVDPIPSLAGMTVTGGRLNAHKALLNLFRVVHTPHPTVCNNGAPYDIDVLIGPAAIVDTNALVVFWNTDGSTNFLASPMSLISNSLYRAQIPLQPAPTTIRYWIQASSRSGQTITTPSSAPVVPYQFGIVPPLGFIVSGAPDNLGTVSPPYGWYTYPSGMVVQASAPWHSDPVDGLRWRCTGWSGMGSVPPAGTSNRVDIVLSRTSAIEWHWSQEYALTQMANVAGIVSTATWWDAAATGMTFTVPMAVTQSGTNYAFVHWLLDGLRRTNTAGSAVNPIPDVIMNAPHNATAIYLDARTDADGDGIQDWWETYHFGSTLGGPTSDADGDGFSDLDEFLDRTDPNRADSSPQPPVILHTPISNPRTLPAPCQVEAFVTDNFQVASVCLAWSRSGGPYQSTNMSDGAVPGHYTAAIPPPGTNGDTFVYYITAADLRGATTTNGPHAFRIDYAVLRAGPDSFDLLLPPETVSNRFLTVSNEGSASLHLTAEMLAAGFSDRMESVRTNWQHGGAQDLWTRSTNRTVSGTPAWYCGNPTTLLYAASSHACLDTPPIYLGASAQLSFWQWIRCELDVQSYRYGWLPNHAWDGGIVELSTNGGASFFQISPVGGYPRKISGWVQSPWAQDTACFAGTGAWEHVTFDLGAYTARSVIIRFHFGSDDNTQDEGWYLDDVVVTPSSIAAPWLSITPMELDLPAGYQTNLTVTFSSAGIPTGDTEGAVRLLSDAANRPVADFPARLLIRSPPALLGFRAAQTSTHGEGIVTVSNWVADADGDVCTLELAWSTNAGVDWNSPVLAEIRDTGNKAILLSSNRPPIANILTTDETVPCTNLVTATWVTAAGGSGIPLATGALVRARLWDGMSWSPWSNSAPFMIDNEPPGTPIRLRSPTHLAGKWSTSPAISIIWSPPSDGNGSGLMEYLYGVSTNELDDSVIGSTTNRVVSSPSLADGSNWWLSVRARDACGNLSPAARMGPYWIDATPPSTAGALITLALSPFGAYVVGSTSMTGTWSGFTDAASGIQGYYYSLSNDLGTAGEQWTTATSALLTNAQVGATNTVYVRARDALGQIGSAVSASYLVLEPASDLDGDHLSNAQEEIAGTDACNPASALRLAPSEIPPDPASGVVLQWPSVTNRLYTLFYCNSLFPETNWCPVPDFVRIPGNDGTMVYTDRTAVLSPRFFRISVETP